MLRAGQDGDQGGFLVPAGGAWELWAAASLDAGSNPATAKLERLRPGWGSVGKSVGAARELTVSRDVVVPGRMARGPRGAAELQEKCQIVEGAQRRGQRGPHAARSGRGAPPPHIGAPQPAEPAPAVSYPAPPPPSPAGPGSAPAAGSERTPSPPPPTAGLFACAEGHSVPPRTRPPPRSPP